MKLTWHDIEAHRSAATPLQWRRMEAYFKECKGIAEIGVAEGKGGSRYNSLFLSIGRGCMAVFKSMLDQPVRVPTEAATVAAMQAIREQQAREEAAACDAPVPVEQAIAVGMRVEGDTKMGHDWGRVEHIEGNMAVVVWDRGFKTFAPLSDLTPVAF